MFPPPRGSPSRRCERVALRACLALGLLAGCAAERGHWTRPLPEPPAAALASLPYQVHHPDVVEIQVAKRSDLSGTRAVGADGRIDLGKLGRLRVDGHTAPEIADLLARAVHLPAADVAVRVSEFNSQQVYLYGQVRGAQRPVPYQGGEPVLHLLQRVGGITPGAEPNDIYVVRTRLAAGRPPEVFHVQLRDIVSGRDPRTNLILQPFDEVYVGETRKSCFFKCLPPVLRPLFKSVCGMRGPCALGPSGSAPAPPPERPPLREHLAALGRDP